jgi:Tfp pilus assembly ATPase PilU
MPNNHTLSNHEFPVRKLPKVDTSITARAEKLLTEQLSHNLNKPYLSSKRKKLFDSPKEVSFQLSAKKEKFPSELALN